MANPNVDMDGMREGFKSLFRKIAFVLFALAIYRLGTFITLPGINFNVLNELYEQQSGTIFDLLNMFSGGALERSSVLALGIMPYITASIIMQMLSHILPSLVELRKEGQGGQAKINGYTRYLTLVLCIFQAVSVTFLLTSQSSGDQPLVTIPAQMFVIVASISLVTGTMFLMWLGEQITERGLGNGISILIFASIVAGLPSALGSTYEMARVGELSELILLFIMAMVIAVVFFVVFTERAQRRIAINYPQRQVGRQLVAGQTTHLPYKINMAGVIPPIFASAIILFPATVARYFSDTEGRSEWVRILLEYMQPGQPIYVFVYASGIIFFAFFYTALVYEPRDVADRLRKEGAYISGIRPGQKTSEYLEKVISRLTMVGAIYLCLVCLLPEFLIIGFDVPFYFGGTSVLIMVVVLLDFVDHVKTHMLSYQYSRLLKKAGMRGAL
ncbi:MAG: preprotein translocase subunit SecY [Gammaproteobacteria bacterium]|nr:preprotein translocase subunit SecY [Pseudomonadota bacterium]MCH9662682.1 preprotein translocase subunit SecY [Gammaproteobacteria bacterium]